MGEGKTFLPISRFSDFFIQTKNNAELFSKYAKFYENPLVNSSLPILTKKHTPGHTFLWRCTWFFDYIKIRKMFDIAWPFGKKVPSENLEKISKTHSWIFYSTVSVWKKFIYSPGKKIELKLNINQNRLWRKSNEETEKKVQNFLWVKVTNWITDIQSFFVRTFLIRTLRLRLTKILRTYWEHSSGWKSIKKAFILLICISNGKHKIMVTKNVKLTQILKGINAKSTLAANHPQISTY